MWNSWKWVESSYRKYLLLWKQETIYLFWNYIYLYADILSEQIIALFSPKAILESVKKGANLLYVLDCNSDQSVHKIRSDS